MDLDGRKDNHRRVHAKDLKKKQKYAAVQLQQQNIPAKQQVAEDLCDDADNEDTGEDFTKLASQTAAVASFTLRSEQDWNKDINLGTGSDQFARYFDLDVKQLAEAMLTIPFHERLDLRDVELTEGLLQSFTAAVGSGSGFGVPKAQCPVQLSSVVSSLRIDVEAKEITPPKAQAPAPDPKDDLQIQDWLDNVLDI